MSRKLTKEEVVEKARKIHGDKYDYSLFLSDDFEYENGCQKIPIICHKKDKNGVEHGVFMQSVGHHIRGEGCNICSGRKQLTIDEVIKRSKEAHGDKYDYSLITEYESINDTKLPIICHKKDSNGCEHGVFMCTLKNHVNHKRGCPKCNGGTKYFINDFKEILKLKHGDLITFEDSDYVNYNTPINFVCRKHGNFITTPHDLIHSKGCPFCSGSRLEASMKYTLDLNAIKYIHNKTFEWLVNEEGNKLRYDFYLPDYDVVIECHGRQHFESIDEWGGDEYLKKCIKNDFIKSQICEEHGLKMLYYAEKDCYEYPYTLYTSRKEILKEIFKHKKMNKILEDLKERGMVSETFGPLEQNLKPGEYVYCGCDPTSDSLGVHHLLAFMTLKRLKEQGMKPIVLIGGASGSLGDPSFKDKERDAISMDTVMHNCECIKKQLTKILGEDTIFVNNYDWISKFSFLDFMRDVGKKITVNYMIAKDSVKSRLAKDGQGLSFCEFSYSNIQAYDFVHLYEQYGCKIQCGGRDQTGNIDSAFVLAHKRNKVDDLSAFVWPLLTCSDGKKFGKSEGNTVWLDAKKTSPYQFMQYFINLPDADVEQLIKKFTLIPLNEIDELITKHREDQSKRILQRRLAEYMTELVHGKAVLDGINQAAALLFGSVGVNEVDENGWSAIKSEVTTIEVSRDVLNNGIGMLDLAVMHDKIPSKSEARKLIKGNGFSINKEKVTDEKSIVTSDSLINDKYLLLQKGKKDFCLINICV